MSYRYILHEEAVKDLSDAYAWYESQREGLGDDFLLAVHGILKKISMNHEAFSQRMRPHYREAAVRKFPYSIVFIVYKKEKLLLISSIHHHSKDPAKKYRS